MNDHGEQIRIVQETVAGKEITFAHVMGGPAPVSYTHLLSVYGGDVPRGVRGIPYGLYRSGRGKRREPVSYTHLDVYKRQH